MHPSAAVALLPTVALHPDLPSAAGLALAAALGYLAGAVGLARQWPQLRRTCLQRQTSGLSALACWCALANTCTWLAYGVAGGGPVHVGVNSIFVLVHGAVLLTVLGCRRAELSRGLRVGLAAASAAWAAGVALAYLLRGAETVALAGVVLGVSSALPQVALLLRRRQDDTKGVAAATWWLGCVSSVLWALHGVLTGAIVVVCPAVWNLGVSVIMCLLLRPAGLRASQRGVPRPATG